jgi:hypothetical protein
MIDPRNVYPGIIGDYRAWGGNPPSSFLDGAGLVFYGRNERYRDNSLWYVVRSVDSTGVIKEHLKFGPSAGQGILAIDHGYLILTIYSFVGDGQQTNRYVVPGWTRL